MSVPILLKTLYGIMEMTGLYSFEYVDDKRQTVFEAFLMFPPTSKTVTEGTRAMVVPTLSGNYVIDGGNSTKQIDLSGEIYMLGSEPDNRATVHGGSLFESEYEFNRTGLEEFFMLRWALIRFRDYTLRRDGKLDSPLFIMKDTGIKDLFDTVSKKMKKKYGSPGALYDQLKLIFHDYDMDDHFYCKLNNFTSSQEAGRNLFIKYDISLECYGIDNRSSTKKMAESKLFPAEELNNYVAAMI